MISKEFHEVAKIFPLLGGEEYKSMVDDIRANGLIEPIWLHENKIIDGRNRYRGCKDAGVEPRFRHWGGEGSLVSFIISLNLRRRHLTKTQAAVVALDALPHYEAEAKKRQAAQSFFAHDKEIIPEHGLGQSRDFAAQDLAVNPRYIQDAKRISKERPELIEPMRAGELSMQDALKQIRKQPFASDEVEFYTPPKYIDAAKIVLGSIDLDPASSPAANEVVRAGHYYSKADDGLKQKWHGKVYMNPPYGKLGVEFVDKLLEEYKSRSVIEAIILLNTHAVTANWFLPLWNYVLCFVTGRINFYTINGESAGSGPIGSVFVYLGSNTDLFANAFSEFGPIARRIDEN